MKWADREVTKRGLKILDEKLPFVIWVQHSAVSPQEKLRWFAIGRVRTQQ